MIHCRLVVVIYYMPKHQLASHQEPSNKHQAFQTVALSVDWLHCYLHSVYSFSIYTEIAAENSLITDNTDGCYKLLSSSPYDAEVSSIYLYTLHSAVQLSHLNERHIGVHVTGRGCACQKTTSQAQLRRCLLIRNAHVCYGNSVNKIIILIEDSEASCR
jgi:hypothetical protein